MKALAQCRERALGEPETRPMTLRDCPVRSTLDVLRGKWKPLILFHLKRQSRRYAELRRHLPGATEKVLIQQLRELENDHVLERNISSAVPPQVEYRISAYGQTLLSLLQQMADWGQEHRARRGQRQTSNHE